MIKKKWYQDNKKKINKRHVNRKHKNEEIENDKRIISDIYLKLIKEAHLVNVESNINDEIHINELNLSQKLPISTQKAIYCSFSTMRTDWQKMCLVD